MHQHISHIKHHPDPGRMNQLATCTNLVSRRNNEKDAKLSRDLGETYGASVSKKMAAPGLMRIQQPPPLHKTSSECCVFN